MKFETQQCPIYKNRYHTIVNNDASIKVLIKYVDEVCKILDENPDFLYYFAIDIEFHNWRETQDIIAGAIQFAQFFQDRDIATNWKYNKKNTIVRKEDCNLQDGFIVQETRNPKVQKCLSKLFTHNQVRLVFFDISRDLAALTGTGYKFTLEHVYDCQTDPCSIIDTKSHRSLAQTVYDAQAYCFQAATACLEGYIFINPRTNKPEKQHKGKGPLMKNHEYCAVDIVLTAASFIYALFEHGEVKNLEKYQKDRIALYVELTKKDYRGDYFQRVIYFAVAKNDWEEVQHYYESMVKVVDGFSEKFKREDIACKSAKDIRSRLSTTQIKLLQSELETCLIDGMLYDFIMFYEYKLSEGIQKRVADYSKQKMIEAVCNEVSKDLYKNMIKACQESESEKEKTTKLNEIFEKI